MKINYREELNEMLLIKAEKERPGNTMPRCFEYERRVLDTSTIIDGLCKYFEKQVSQSGGAK